MEGISGLVRWADVITSGMDFQRNRRFMTQDANAAIAGAFDAGASEVVVEENHGVEELCDLVLDEIDPRCRVVRGAGRPAASSTAGSTASARSRAPRRRAPAWGTSEQRVISSGRYPGAPTPDNAAAEGGSCTDRR